MRTLCPLFTWAGDNAAYDARAALLNPGDIAVVVSGNSGPQPYDPLLVGQIRELTERGVLVFGYVPTGYGARPLGAVFDDITMWRRSYGVLRPFLDEWPVDGHDAAGLMWGAVRGRAGKQSTPIVVVNPGVPVSWLSVPVGMLAVTWENSTLPTHTPKPWEVALVHSNPAPVDVRDFLRSSGWQWSYSTSDGLDGNPFDK